MTKADLMTFPLSTYFSKISLYYTKNLAAMLMEITTSIFSSALIEITVDNRGQRMKIVDTLLLSV